MIKINNSFSGVYYCSNDTYVYIAPYENFEDAVKLLPHYGVLSANFNPKSLSGHSPIRWGGLMHPCMLFAKFIISYIYASREQLKDYEIVEDVRLFMSKDKYEVSIDRNYNRNGKKYKITIKTGAVDRNGRAVYRPTDDLKSLINKMISEIGIIEAQKHCEYYSTLADLT